MDRKLIFLDIDGTLIASMAPPSGLARKAVQGARAKGHGVFLCTGRNMPIIGADILELGFDGIISSAGAHVEVGGQVLYDSLLPEETVQECLAVFHANGIFCRIEDDKGIYTDPQMEALLKEARADPANSELIRMQREIEAGILIRPYDQYPGGGAYKLCFTSTSLEAVERAKSSLEDRFEFVVHPYGDSTACFNGEIIPRGIDKGSAIRLVCRHLGMEPGDAVAFGDSMNDSEMIRCAGTGIAMGNACRELKDMADIVCGSVEEDGLYYEFENLGFV